MRVSNPLSRLSSTLHLSVFLPLPNALVITLLHSALGVPSCTPFPEMQSQSEEVFVGDPVTLQARVTDGTASEFYWWFSEGRNELNMAEEGPEKTGLKTVCPPNTDCLNSTVVCRTNQILQHVFLCHLIQFGTSHLGFIHTVCLYLESEEKRNCKRLQIWTFTREGIHTVSINASTACGWRQETMYIVSILLCLCEILSSVWM